jgi:hypothetical protein
MVIVARLWARYLDTRERGTPELDGEPCPLEELCYDVA